jgi:two-component system phosphate regulon response regulator PhoB
MAKTKILVVEDNEIVQERYRLLFEEVHKSEYSWILAPTGQRALLALKKHPCPPIDIVVLDWNLPDMEGLAILKRIKSNSITRSIPVLMVTGHTSPQDTVRGFKTGADDYLKKDFANEELIARLQNLCRRREDVIEKQGGYMFDGLSLNPASKTVSLRSKPLALTQTEFYLLKLFLERPNVVHSQTYLGDVLSDSLESLSPETVRKHISNLRQALGSWAEHIEVLRSRGYVLHTKIPVS